MNRSSRSRYAGYAHPDEVLTDAVLSEEQKRETLKHWRATLRRQQERQRERMRGAADAAEGSLLDQLDLAHAAFTRGKGGGATPS